MSVIYTQGGASTIADATTTTAGKVRLATIAEAGGVSELIAVTPAGLQAEIAGLTGGLTYRGLIDVSAFATTLVNASQGDYYKIDTGGTAGDGRVYDSGDAIVINADMGGVYADAKLDKIDNVDPTTSDEITGNHNATSYAGTSTDSVTTHLDGIDSALGLRAPIASPALTGTPTAPTATAGDSSLQIASTAFVAGELSTLASTDLTDSADLARLASPALTGTPTTTTATAGDNSTRIASTAYVDNAVAGGGGGTSYTYSAITSASSPVTAQAWYHYSADASTGAIALNLPALNTFADGDEIRVKLRDASNALTITANGSENIDGSNTYVLDVAYSAITLVAGSTEWEVI